MLEFSQYLENYLWPNFTQHSTLAHTMSIVSMLNEKFRERVPAWEVCTRIIFLPMYLFKHRIVFKCFLIFIRL